MSRGLNCYTQWNEGDFILHGKAQHLSNVSIFSDLFFLMLCLDKVYSKYYDHIPMKSVWLSKVTNIYTEYCKFVFWNESF